MRILICTRPSVASAKAICSLAESLAEHLPQASLDVLVALKDRISRSACRVVVEQYFGEETAWNLGPERHLVSHKLERAIRPSGGRLSSLIGKSNDEIHRFLLSSNWDLIISYNFSYLFREADIAHFDGSIVNVHSGPIPEMRGVNPVFWAMLRSNENHCATIHKVVLKVDAGPIIAQAPCPLFLDKSLVANRVTCYLAAVPFLVEIASTVAKRGEIRVLPPPVELAPQLPKIEDAVSQTFFELGMRAISVDELIEFQRWLTL